MLADDTLLRTNLKDYGAVLSCSAVYNAVQGNFNFWICTEDEFKGLCIVRDKC